jgi:outer membrane protein OmpA-like peptidoglycan-associated protein
MTRKIIAFTGPGIFLTLSAWAQTPEKKSDSVPIYHVTVVDRSVSAVNYQYRSGPTKIDFRGTVLLPQSKGEATVESRGGRTEIDARFQKLETPARFGPEYLTYVLWAITPEGHAKNLGEVLAGASDKAHLHVTTDLQVFGLIVTAEPYSSVRLPSDVVVLENQVRADTVGNTQPIRARFELLPRGTYTYNVPSNQNAFATGPKVSMDQYEQIVEVYQAQNALQIARSQGAGQYAPEVMEKAEQAFRRAQQLQASKAGTSQIVTAAREAAQTAEDARALTATRKKDAELTEAREQLAREQQLRTDAEAAARQAQAQAQQDRQAPEQRNVPEQRQDRTAPLLNGPAAPPPPPPVQQRPEARLGSPADENGRKMDRRVNLFRQLKAATETLDTSRGLVLIVHDADFRGTDLNQSVAAKLAAIAPVIVGEPGLRVEVEGYTDASGSQADASAEQRAQSVRDALVRGGLRPSTVSVASMGSGRPIASNSSPAGREQNRRVEIVISGDSIGTVAAWDKPYTLNVER